MRRDQRVKRMVDLDIAVVGTYRHPRQGAVTVVEWITKKGELMCGLFPMDGGARLRRAVAGNVRGWS